MKLERFRERVGFLILTMAVLASPSVRLVESNATKILLEFSLTEPVGSLSFANAGIDPNTQEYFDFAVIGIPADINPLVRVKSISWQPLRTAVWNKTLPSAGKSVLTTTGWVRSQRIAGIAFYPYRRHQDQLEYASKALVEISWPSQPLAKTRNRNTAEPLLFEEQLRLSLANYEQAQAWRTMPRQSMAKSRDMGVTGPRVRIEVASRGMVRITRDQFDSLDIDVSSMNPNAFRIRNQGREIPIWVQGSGDGRFDSQDAIIFYGTHTPGVETYYSQYTFTNVYWLTWEGGQGLRYASQSVSPRTDPEVKEHGKDIPVAPLTRDTIHIEYDTRIRYLGNITTPETFSVDTVLSREVDLWYWSDIGANDLTTIEFSIPPALPDKGLKAFLRAGLRGLSISDSLDPDHSYKILLQENEVKTSQGLDSVSWNGQDEFTFETQPFDNTLLRNGSVKLSFIRRPGAADQSMLNWVEIGYYPDRKASENKCVFQAPGNAKPGLYEFEVTGFTEPNIDLWDLSGRRLQDAFVKISNDTSFALLFHDSIDSRIQYLALSTSQYLKPKRMQVDTLQNLRSPQNRADVIVLTAACFIDSISQWTQWRESQGYEVKVVDVQDVYNEFNHGILDPAAIRDFVRYAVANWSRPTPWALLIIGDTTHDFDKTPLYRNVVPTYLSQVPRWGPAANDDWFVNVCGDDPFPDLMVGRLPVGSQETLQATLDKIIENETSLLRGEWRDKFLLIGGYEQAFTRINNTFSQDIIAEQYRQIRIDTDHNSPYSFGDQSHQKLQNTLEAGVALVTFSGHGGGNVWSDADGIFNIDDVRRLRNDRKPPVVFSFTCLTGAFEYANPNWPPLGENMLHHAYGGALAFYGAAAYVSSDADEKLSREMVSVLINSKPDKVGSIIWQGELNTLLKYGNNYAISTRQYNLLGDPLSAMNYPLNDLKLQSSRQIVAGDSLVVACKIPRFSKGFMKIGIYGNIELLQSKTIAFESDSFNVIFPLKPQAVVAKGFVRAYAWNDTADSRGTVSFSHNSLNIGHVYLSKTDLGPGDTATVFVPLYEPQVVRTLQCLYGTGPAGTNLGDRQIRMVNVNDTLFKSDGTVRVSDYVSEGDQFWVVFRAIIDTNILQAPGSPYIESEPQGFPMKEMADLSPTDINPIYLTGLDTVTAIARFVNLGLVTATGVKVQLLYSSDSISFIELGQDSLTHDLDPGKCDSLTFGVAPMQAKVLLQLKVNSDNAIDESNQSNNTANQWFEINQRRVAAATDTLYSLDSNAALHPAANLNDSIMVSLTQADTIGRSPSQGMDVCTLAAAGARWYTIQSSSSEDTMELVFLIDTAALSALIPDSLSRISHTGVYRWSTQIKRWIWQGGTLVQNRISFKTASFSDFCVGFRRDLDGPNIVISSKGRLLLFTDYIPVGATVDFHIKDASGVDINSFQLLVNGEQADTTRVSYSYPNSDPLTLLANYMPDPANIQDSIVIRVADVNGNYSEKKLTYLLGEELTIKFLGTYPNPFINKTVFAFSVTDACKEALLQVFTMAGRPVRSWNLIEEFGQNMIGYQELEWDGTDTDGYQIANGTYYVKLKVKNEQGKKAEKITPAVRLRGYTLD